MTYRMELEHKLAHEIHYLPTEAMETLLKLTALIKKSQPTESAQAANNFSDFIRSSPLMDSEIELTCEPSLCRDINDY